MREVLIHDPSGGMRLGLLRQGRWGRGDLRGGLDLWGRCSLAPLAVAGGAPGGLGTGRVGGTGGTVGIYWLRAGLGLGPVGEQAVVAADGLGRGEVGGGLRGVRVRSR